MTDTEIADRAVVAQRPEARLCVLGDDRIVVSWGSSAEIIP